MTSPVPGPRRFTDPEVALVLRRAAEMQAADSRQAGPSLAELEDVAREAGIDPALVRRAVAELDTARPPDTATRLRGGVRQIRLERVVDGEFPGEALEAAVAEVRRTFGDAGVVSTLGRTVTWSATPATGANAARARRAYVSIIGRPGQTVLRVEEDLGALSGSLFGGLVGGLGGGMSGSSLAVGIAALQSVALGFGIAGVALGGSYALARTLYGRAARRRTAELEALLDRLAAAVSGGEP